MADGGVSGVTGDYGPLATLRRQVGGLANGSFKRDLLAQLAQVAAEQIRLGFEREGDPYGKAWPPRKRAGDGHPILRDYWVLYVAAQRIVPTANGLRLAGGMPVYAAVHQYGYTYEAGMRTNRIAADGSRIRGRARRRRAPVRIDIVAAGARTVPRRQFLPEQHQGGLGAIWEAAFEAAAAGAIRAHFGL